MAIVTGGGPEILRGFSLCLAEEGANVVIVDINSETAAEVADEVKGLGRKSLALVADVSCLRVLAEVLTTPFTFPITPHVLFWNGITPVFCDIDEKSMTIDANKKEHIYIW